jgi:hypothetical protein
MADNIPTWYVHQYSTNIQLMLQQRGSRLEQAVMTGSHVGTQASPVDQVFPVTANKVVSRFAAMPRVDALLDRRWAFPVDYDLPQLIDSFDKLRLITDPSSSFVQNAYMALGRAKDVEIIGAFFGSAKTGVEAATTTTFLTNLTTNATPGQVVSVLQGSTGASNATVAKLREAKRQLMANEVDLEFDPLYAAFTSKELDNLLAEVQIIDADYNGGQPVLADGKITRFLGINFLHTELLTAIRATDDNGGTSTPCPIWAKSGMYLGMWNDIETDLSQRKDLQGLPWQAYCKATVGSTRVDEKRVTKVWCN